MLASCGQKVLLPLPAALSKNGVVHDNVAKRCMSMSRKACATHACMALHVWHLHLSCMHTVYMRSVWWPLTLSGSLRRTLHG